MGRPGRRPREATLGDGGIDDALSPEIVEEAPRDLERATVDSDVLPDEEDRVVGEIGKRKVTQGKKVLLRG